MAVEGVLARIALLEQATLDNSEVRERGKRNEREINFIREELLEEIQGLRGELGIVREEVRSMYRAFVTASISFVLAAAGIIATLVALFK